MDWDAAFEEVACETAIKSDMVNDERMIEKRWNEHLRGVLNGWHDEEGNSLLVDDEESEEGSED